MPEEIKPKVPPTGEEGGQTSGKTTTPSVPPKEDGSDELGDLKTQIANLTKQVGDLERLKGQFQSERDRAKSDLAKQRGDMTQELATLRQRMELLIPEGSREQYRRDLNKAELEMYRKQESLTRLRQHITQEYGVPDEALKDFVDGAEMTRAALGWLAEKAKGQTPPTTPTPGETEGKKGAGSVKPLEPGGAGAAPPQLPPGKRRAALETRAKAIMEERNWRPSMWGSALLLAQTEAEATGGAPHKSKV